MAQSDLIVNQNFLNKNIETIRMIENDMDKLIFPNERKDNFQCTYFRRRTSKTSDKRKCSNGNQTLSDDSNDRTDNESESESVVNVLKWLQSLPRNFTKCDLKNNTSLYKLQETDQNLYRFYTRQENSKSLGSFLKRKSIDKIPLKGKNSILLEHKKKVGFVEFNETQHELGRTQMKSFQRKILTNDKKSSVNSFVLKLSKTSGKSDSHSMKTKSRQNPISVKNNQCQRTVGIFRKNISENKLKSKLSGAQRRKIQKKIADNKRLIYVLNEIIKTVDKNDLSDRKKNNCIRKNYNKKKNDGGCISILNNNKSGESRTKKPIFKNPVIEKTLDDTMRNTLKRYIYSNGWNHFKENNIEIDGESPFKKKKCMMHSLTSADSLTPYMLI
ncbi:uncharacterized protein LOC118446029 [Vespa mandarinia]|uniref:uncharacterized protein LOC118446029 n=1 Tax=Vespa mandarinia TaxID=7446 RepID=UPI00160CD7A1|nr:uncharacterized protein LOC118446029 [Vespa mandarinia]